MSTIASEAKPVRTKFAHPDITADGSPRAEVAVSRLETLWFNTGTLCNLTCANCYIESSPRNDRLSYLSREEVLEYLDEIRELDLPTREIGFTGGEPFMNPDLVGMLEDVLERGFEALVLTNAMRPMMKVASELVALRQKFATGLAIRVSVDHYDPSLHEEERGPRSWRPTLEGLCWLRDQGFDIHVAGRTRWGDDEAELRRGYGALFEEHRLPIDADDRRQLVLFPEMDPAADVPEITTDCWSILGVDPSTVMCSTSRMVVKHRGEDRPTVVSCTLLPYEEGFRMGRSLGESLAPVKLNHVHCARFCVLGGASCSG